MKTSIILVLMTTLFVLAGCLDGNENNLPAGGLGNENSSITAGKLIAGATCEQDSDCVYALNAYPYQKCVSPNCPPPENAQPEPNDPAYEWESTHVDECVNNTQLNGKNVQGEDLLLDTRAATCGCETIELPGTSIDGQKICRKKLAEETPLENSGE